MTVRHDERRPPQVQGPQEPEARLARRRRTDRWLLIVAIVAVVSLIAAGVVASISTTSVVAPAPVIESKLGHVACTAPERCVAVGSTGSRYTIRSPYSVRSADGSWLPSAPVSPLDDGDSFLDSVACVTGTRCMAVGRQEVPAPYLGAKSGGDRQLVEMWNGREWRVLTSPFPPRTTDAQLAGVDCVASTCMAVGSYDPRGGRERVLTQLWNGSAWKMFLPPKPRVMQEPTLSGVSCVSPTSCWAVGWFSYELAFGEVLTPLIMRWNGTEWRFEPSGRLGELLDTTLGAVACPSEEVCVAVGSRRRGRSTFSSFAEVRTDGRWAVSPPPDPPHSRYANLIDVDCPSADRCIGVGYAFVEDGPLPVVEWWDGSSWTLGRAPAVSGATEAAISSVSCPTPTTCVVAGNFRSGSPAEHAFTSTWDGEDWTTVLAPDAAL